MLVDSPRPVLVERLDHVKNLISVVDTAIAAPDVESPWTRGFENRSEPSVAADVRTCPVCGSTDETHVFREANIDVRQLDAFAFASRKVPEYMHHRIIECPSCELLYVSPIPSLAEMERAYHGRRSTAGKKQFA